MTKIKSPDVNISDELSGFAKGETFSTILADPPWQFQNRTGKMAPEHKRLSRYGTLGLADIVNLPVGEISKDTAHLYLWVPNALLREGLKVMASWGFEYKTNIVWHKIRKDGGPDGRGVGFYFRNTTELVLFGTRGKNARTLAPGRRQVNIVKTQKREHSRKPDELYDIIEACSSGPYLELFARGPRKGWRCWGDQADTYHPTWATYANHSGRQLPTPVLKVDSLHQSPKSRDLRISTTAPMKETTKTSVNKAEPSRFVERLLRASSLVPLGASAAYDDYVRQCAVIGTRPLDKLPFWRLLSAKAADLGIPKLRVNGRVVYSRAPVSTAA